MQVRSLVLAPIVFAAIVHSARADEIVNLGGGWQATIFDEDKVDLIVDFVSIEEDVLIIQKFANFNEIDPFTGLPKPLSIGFSQIADDANTVSRIIITDEFAFNNSGQNWTSFTMALLGNVATFDPVASDDFSIDPFDTTTYSDDFTVVTFSGGVVLNGSTWTPGLDKGGLVITIDLTRDLAAKFVLKESPIPAPGVLALFGLAAVCRRRRRG